MTAELQLILPARLEELPGLTLALERWAEEVDLPADALFAANLAVEELLVNVVSHGLHGDGAAVVRVAARRGAAWLFIEFRDTAPAFDPFQMPSPDLTSSVEDRAVGGLGVHLIRTLMDECGYTRIGDENVVCLGKRLNDDKDAKGRNG